MKRPIASMATGLMLAITLVSSTAMAQGHGKGREKHEEKREDKREAKQQERNDRRVSQQEQERRIAEERARQASYQRALDQRVRLAQAQQAALQTQRRNAQLAYQQQYLANLQAQRQRVAAQRNYNTDPYYTTAPQYRYRVNNVTRTTNSYGADVLKQAVNYGYDQGVQAGRADKQDGRSSSYRTAFAYQDANYGYNGQYVSQSDYNYYFREGFRRGYGDGYASTSQYGSVTNTGGSILGTVLSSILGLVSVP
ncbi:MAG: hypothetical protein ABIY52_03185 [Gemmatimonadaceae bacterium]